MTTLHLRRLSLALALPGVLLLSACGVRADFTIHDNDTVDYGMTLWDDTGSGALTKDECTKKLAGTGTVPEGTKATYTFTEYEGFPACEIKVSGDSLANFASTGKSGSITHADGSYTLTIPKDVLSREADIAPEAGIEGLEMTISATFPGKVTEVSGNGTKDGNTATWKNVLDEPEDLRAVAVEASDTTILSGASGRLLVGGLLVLVVAAVGFVVVRKRKVLAAQAAAARTGTAQGGDDAPGTSSSAQDDVSQDQDGSRHGSPA